MSSTENSSDSGQNSLETASIDRVPTGLRARGRALWADVAGRYALRPDERRILEDSCRLADTIAALERAMKGQPLTVKGSAGQPVLNPLMAEQRAHRLAVGALLKQLRLPDEAAGRPNQHREAAQSRWANAPGRDAP
jgi:hypothetical protein